MPRRRPPRYLKPKSNRPPNAPRSTPQSPLERPPETSIEQPVEAAFVKDQEAVSRPSYDPKSKEIENQNKLAIEPESSPTQSESLKDPRVDSMNPSALPLRSTSSLVLEGKFAIGRASVRVYKGRREISGFDVLEAYSKDGSTLEITVMIEGSVALGDYSLVVIDALGQSSNRVRFEVKL